MVGRLQRSQLSVQALSRLSSVYVYLLASRWDTEHLVLVAFQGVLFAVPYTLMESLVGRPLSAGLVPAAWNVESWAKRAAVATVLPVGAIGYLAAYVALPEASHLDRLLMLAPVLLQLPIEALFWATARTRPRRQANLIPQLTAAGTMIGATVFVFSDVRVDVAALPAQLLVLAGVLTLAGARGDGALRPGVWHSVRLGSTYLLAAAVDLSYAVALPAVAGALVGNVAIVVLRALDLAFGPFHVALSATTREDIVAGRASRFATATRALTVAVLVAVSAAVTWSRPVRELFGIALVDVGTGVVAGYCLYKAILMVDTWLSTRHLIWAEPGPFLWSAIGSRVIAFGGVAVATLWVSRLSDLVVQLIVGEALIVSWFLFRRHIAEPARAQSPAGG